jgi:hypothetical protein
MSGAPFAARYSFPPNDRGYCGRPTFRRALKSYLSGSAGPPALEREIRKFPVHYAYLKLIARENGMRPFDMEVVRAFWIGNRLLEGIPRKSLEGFIRKDLFRGEDGPRVRRLCKGLPEGIMPHHSFNVLFVNFVTDAVERSEENFDSCCITWGEARTIGGRSATVMRESISWDGAFSLKKRLTEIEVERSGVRLAGDLRKGDLVSAHWGMAVQKITRRDADSLRRYTLRNMEAINKR